MEELEKPEPRKNEILIRVQATAVNAADWRLRKPDPAAVRLFFGLTKPRNPIPGGVLAGIVEAAGGAVTRFKSGDRVFGSTGMSFGAYAEYKCLKETATLALIPESLGFEEAAAIPFGGLTALHYLQKAGLKAGQNVLIYGASGAVGSAAVQLAKNSGAHVTGVCSTGNLELVKSLGADKVLDYTKADFALPESTYDLIYVTIGQLGFRQYIRALAQRGTLAMSDAGPGDTFRGIWHSLTGSHKVVCGVAKETRENLEILAALAATGKFRAAIDRSYILKEMAEAHRYAEGGHKKGNVVVRIPG